MARGLRYALWTVLVVVMALLVAVAPAAAATNTAVLIHTTASDFNNGTLSDVTVTGSGESADVDFRSDIDSFEDGSMSEYGGTGSASVTSAQSTDGDNSILLESASNVEINSTSGLLQYPGQGDTFRFDVRLKDATAQAQFRFGFQDDDNTFQIEVNDRSGDEQFSLIKRDGGTRTVLDTDTSFDPATGTWYTVEVEWGSTITATLYNQAGTQLSQVSATDSTYTSGGIGFRQGQFNDGQYFDNVRINDKIGSYVGDSHSVENPQNGFTDLTLDGVNATVTWEENSGSGWTTVRTDQYSTSGNKSVSLSAATASTLRVNVTFNDTDTDDDGTAQLHDEGVTFTNHAPEFNNSTASPSGGTTLTSSTVTLSIDLNDTNFGTIPSDSVDVRFYVNGSQVGTNTSITSNGTVTFDYTPTTGGNREWSVVAADSFGGTNVSNNFTFTVPSQITIREETSPHTNITGSDVVVKFFENTQNNPTIVERNDSDGDGNISLAGLPVNSEFVATVKADGYHNRTIVIKDIFDQSNVFLLNTSRTSVNNTFTLDDATGDFSSEDGVTFFIEKAINQSKYDTGGWDWVTVSGDNLGAQQFYSDDLEFEDRYRLRIDNDAGDTRILGEYVAENSGTVTLDVGSVNLTPTEGSTYAWNATFNDSDNNFIRFSFNDTADGTTDLDLTIYEWGNESNVLTTDLDNAGPFGTFSFSQQLTGDDVSKTWVVEWNATKNGSAIGGSEVVGRDVIGPTLPIATVWLEVGSVGALVLMAGAVGGLISPAVGALVLAMLGGLLWQLGFLPAEIGGGAVVLALLVAASWLVFQNRSEP